MSPLFSENTAVSHVRFQRDQTVSSSLAYVLSVREEERGAAREHEVSESGSLTRNTHTQTRIPACIQVIKCSAFFFLHLLPWFCLPENPLIQAFPSPGSQKTGEHNERECKKCFHSYESNPYLQIMPLSGFCVTLYV